MDININNTTNTHQPQSTIPSSYTEKKNSVSKRWLLVGLGLFLSVLVLAFFVYLVLNFKKLYRGANQGNSILTTTPIQDEKTQTAKTYKLEEIFTSEEKISSSLIAPDNAYAFVVTQKSTPVWNIFKENENGPVMLVMDNLISVNLNNKEKREFDIYELASKEIIDPLKTIPAQTQFTLYVDLLKWSADSNDFWGAINLVSSGDPPVNDSVSVFKVNTKDWSVEKFALPGRFINSLREQNLNLENKSVLYESATRDNELLLYLYEFQTKESTTVISYSNNVFSKYLPGDNGFLGYFYPEFLETEPRQLNAKWIDNRTISYIDFVTRQEVTKKIE